MEKPPILSDEMIDRLCRIETRVAPDVVVETFIPNPLGRDIAQVQLDADVAYYEQEEKELVDSFTQTMREMVAQNRLEIQQAKAEVAREMIEVYDCYIKLLGEEIDTLSPLAISHGWRSTREEAGKKCRADIQEVKSKYGGQK